VNSAVNNIGLLYYSQGDAAQAADYFRRSAALSRELGDEQSASSALGNLGLAYRLQGDYARALDSYEKSREIDEKTGNKRALGESLTNVAVIYGLQGDHAKAREYFTRSVALKEESGDRSDLAETLDSLAADYYATGDYKRALEEDERAVALARQIELPDTLWRALTGRGRALRALGDATAARQSFAEAADTVERLRAEVAGDERQRQRFFADKVAPYREMVDLLVAENDAAGALAYAERARARVLLDVIQSGRVDIDKAMTADEQARERELVARLVSLNKELAQENASAQPDAARLADIKAGVERARLDYEAFQTALYAAHPELKVRCGEVQPFSLDAARAAPRSGRRAPRIRRTRLEDVPVRSDERRRGGPFAVRES
jgi:tetratricopeptide (TPR) repeat protein